MADFIAGAVLTAAQLDTAFNTFTINAQTGTTYTLGAADAGEMVTVNNNSGGTVTIPTNATTAFATGTHISILNAGTAGTFTIAGAGGVTFTSDVTTINPRAAITVVKTATNTWYGVAGGGLGKASVSGTTGSPTVDSSSRPGKTIYKFTGSGSITVGTAGSAEVLVIGGGGSGFLGGGGAGGVNYTTNAYLTAGTLTVTVGAGGSGLNGTPGNASAVSAYVGCGGGMGNSTGYPGGSGGGGTTGGAASPPFQGNAGGNGVTAAQGGGGGAGAAGSAGSGTVAGAGGAGISNSITGSAVTYAGGGGGGASAGTGGSGGSGGGGTGSSSYNATAPTAGSANTGGGGGGGNNNGGSTTAGAGGSGYVVVVIG